jgi:hypothetical protein
MNKNFVLATCQFLDTSGAYEMNAEVGYTDNCSITTEDGTTYGPGTGTATAAANHEENPGGTVNFRCKVPVGEDS